MSPKVRLDPFLLIEFQLIHLLYQTKGLSCKSLGHRLRFPLTCFAGCRLALSHLLGGGYFYLPYQRMSVEPS